MVEHQETLTPSIGTCSRAVQIFSDWVPFGSVVPQWLPHVSLMSSFCHHHTFSVYTAPPLSSPSDVCTQCAIWHPSTRAIIFLPLISKMIDIILHNLHHMMTPWSYALWFLYGHIFSYMMICLCGICPSWNICHQGRQQPSDDMVPTYLCEAEQSCLRVLLLLGQKCQCCGAALKCLLVKNCHVTIWHQHFSEKSFPTMTQIFLWKS